jgi:protein subunit release factor B
MYRKFVAEKGWQAAIIHEHQNDHGGFRNVTFEVIGKNAYGTLKNESGVHRWCAFLPLMPSKCDILHFRLLKLFLNLKKFRKMKFLQDEFE